MKKIFLILVVLCTTMVGFSQKTLFKGVKSGMTMDDYFSYCKQDTSLIYEIMKKEGANIHRVMAILYNDYYSIEPYFNEDGKLKSVIVDSPIDYAYQDYNKALKFQARKLFTYLEEIYGEPVYNSWFNWQDLQINNRTMICAFEKLPLKAFVLITNDNNKYSTCLLIQDMDFEDIEQE